MRVLVQPYVTGGDHAPLIGTPHGAPHSVDLPESPQLGDELPPIPGYSRLIVRHRAWTAHAGSASLVLLVEATCRAVAA